MNITTKHTLWAGLIVAAPLLFTACGGGNTEAPPAVEETAAPVALSVPFTIQIEQDTTFTNLVGVHSAAVGQTSDGKWVIVGGRVNGFHGFTEPGEDFPYATANQHMIVYDPTTKVQSYMDVSSLSDHGLALALSASNTQHEVSNGYLVMCGGYVQDSTASTDSTATSDYISQISIDAFATGIVNNDVAAVEAAISYGQDARVQVTGGELFAMSDGYYYLVFGHKFNGTYSNFQAGNGTVRNTIQQYTDEVRRFQLSGTGSALTVGSYSALTDTEWSVPVADTAAYDTLTQAQQQYFASQYHRRDLNVMPTVLDAAGTIGLGAYSGVFTCPDPPLCNKAAAWVYPVYITPGTSPSASVDQNLTQQYNAYSCWNMAIYDPGSTTMYNTFFGGLGVTGNNNWTDTVATIARNVTDGSSQEFVNTTVQSSTGGFVGSEGELVLNSQSAMMFSGSDEVWDYSSMDDTTVVGYLYGGIVSPTASGNGTTTVNDELFKVTIIK